MVFHRTIRKNDSYVSDLAKLLPAEMVAVYTALNGIVLQAGDLVDAEKLVVGWIVFGVVFLVTIAYLILQNRKNEPADKMKWWEILLNVIAFAIWALAVGQLLRTTFPGTWKLTYENLLVGGWTLIVPALVGAAKGKLRFF